MLVDASPFKGPRRYLTINQACPSPEARDAVAKKSRLMLKSLGRPAVELRNQLQEGQGQEGGFRLPLPKVRAEPAAPQPPHKAVRTQSPGKAQRTPSQFHGIREDFSPSPVAARPSVTRNVFHGYRDDSLYKKTPRVDMAKLNSTALSAAMRSAARDEAARLSVSFQPTPARLRPESQAEPPSEDATQKELEDEVMPPPQNPDVATRGIIPCKPPSESSEVTFKMPIVPQKGQRKGSQDNPVSSSESEAEADHVAEKKYLHSWIPRLKKGRLYIEGDLLDFDTSKDTSSDMTRRYMTSRITRRISANVVGSKKTLYVLEGILAVKDFEEEKNQRTPSFIIDKFMFGFPENWEKMTKHWIRMEAQNSKNYANMSLISSTMLSNMSNFSNNTTYLSNISAIAANASGFIRNRSVNLSVTVNTQTNIDPKPLMRTDPTRANDDLAAIDEEPVNIPGEELPEEVEEEVITAADGEGTEEETDDRPRRKKKGHTEEGSEQVPNEHISEEVVDSIETPDEEIEEDNGISGPDEEAEDVASCSHKKEGVESSEDSHHRNTETAARKVRKTSQDRSFKTFCETCQASFKNYWYHYQSASHLRAVAEIAALGDTLKDSGEVDEERNYHCHPCKYSTNSLKEFDSHIDLQVHMKRMGSHRGVKTNLKCNLCNFSCDRTDRYKIHLKTLKHGKNDSNFNKNLSSNSAKSKKKSNVQSHASNKKKDSSSNESDANSPVGNRQRKNKINSVKEALLRNNDENVEDVNENVETNIKSMQVQRKRKITVRNEVFESDDDESRGRKVEKPKRYKDNLKIVKKKNTVMEENVAKVAVTESEDDDHEENVEKPKISLKKKKQTNPVSLDVTATQSRFGRTRKVNKKYVRQSCVYNTPVEDSAEKDKNVIKRNSKDNAKLPVESSPEHDNGIKFKNKAKPNARRVVEDHDNMIEESSPEVIKSKSKAAKKVPNPFKKPSLVENDNNETEQPVNVGEILKKISVKPKTVKQRLQNAEAMKEYNENHEDDIFGEQPSSKSSKISLKASKTTLLNDPDSDSDQDISVHSARTPVTGWYMCIL